MVTSSAVIGLVTLFLHGTPLNDQYIPEPVEKSNYHYKNSTLRGGQYFTVKEDKLFKGYIFFPKCCPPGFSYEPGNKECSKTKNVPIYEELSLNIALIKSTLLECPVVLDRYVEKKNLQRYVGSGLLVVEGEIFQLGTYCLDNIVQDSRVYVIRLCREKDYCSNGTRNGTRDWCIRKCCQDGLAFENYKCTLTPKSGVRVKFNRNYYEKTDGYALDYSSDLKCSVANWLEYQEVNFTVRTNGTLFNYNDNKEYTGDEYCLDTMHNTDTDRVADMVVLCEFSKGLHLKWDFTRALVIITCICLAATVFFYIFHDKPQKMVIISFCTVDFIFWVMYCMRIFYVDFVGFCTVFGYIYFFMSISRLSWLNVLSCEIWLTIRNPGTTFGKTKQNLFRLRLCYIAYAVLIPILFTSAFIMAHREVHSVPEAIHPYIDVSSCAIDAKGPGYNYGYIYLYIPVTILVIINLILYVKTLLHFLNIRRNMKNVTATDTSQPNEKIAKKNKRRGVIIIKLGLVMGVTCIYYIFSYLARLAGHPVLQFIGDVLMFTNLFEGVYFFVIFVVKWRDVKKLLYKTKILKKKDSGNDDHSTSTESVNEMPLHTFN